MYSDNDIESFEKDIFIINKASLNIIFGWGGPLTIAISFSENNIVYIDNLEHEIFNSYPQTNQIIFYRNLSSFLKNINNLLK